MTAAQAEIAPSANHEQQVEAYNLGWNTARWSDPRNCPFFDRERRREYVAGYNDGKAYAAKVAA